MRTIYRGVPEILCVSFAFSIIAGLTASTVFGKPQVGARGSAKTELPPIVPLHLKDTTAFPATAPNALGGGTQCDSDGNVFLQSGAWSRPN